ncbi:MAG: response regulator [Burkholderiales bacterium]|nr:MAG: response regulator [Burkholderiales bacterium]
MSDKPSFTVTVVGLDAQHLRLIEVVFRHIHYNRYAFRLVAPDATEAADVLIAGVGDPAGRDALERARARGRPAASIAVIGPDELNGGRHAIEIGQLVRQLLPILNRVVELEGLAGGPRRMRGATRVDREQPDAGSAGSEGRPRVLVIDRDESIRRQLADAFARMGLDMDTASSCDEALERLVMQPADLALLDPTLSGGDGLRLARTIRREPDWRDLPIVVLSERRSPLDVIRGAFAGCSAYLAKPVDYDDLHRTVVRQLGRVRPPERLPSHLRLAAAHR